MARENKTTPKKQIERRVRIVNRNSKEPTSIVYDGQTVMISPNHRSEKIYYASKLTEYDKTKISIVR